MNEGKGLANMDPVFSEKPMGRAILVAVRLLPGPRLEEGDFGAAQVVVLVSANHGFAR
jgi:hypothetical protein